MNPGLIVSYHGCPQRIADAVISGKNVLQPSQSDYECARFLHERENHRQRCKQSLYKKAIFNGLSARKKASSVISGLMLQRQNLNLDGITTTRAAACAPVASPAIRPANGVRRAENHREGALRCRPPARARFPAPTH